MKQWRIAGLILVAALAAWLLLRSYTPEEEPVAVAPVPMREAFHASKPLRVQITSADSDPAWLARELRYLLIRGKMRVAPIGPQMDAGPGAQKAFTLRIELPGKPQTAAKLALLAPDGVIERETGVDFGNGDKALSQIAIVQAFAKELPAFLDAAHSSADWASFIGTDDAVAYDSFVRSSNELLGASGRGFTQPSAADNSPTVERLESLTRRHRGFVRAWSLLSLGYLSLGGEDEASLTQIAESTAERALALDPALADAQSALGLVRLRRGEWVAATEHFDAALALDANEIPALEGFACLLMDVGHAAAALPIAQRAVALQAGSVGANECLAFAQLATGTSTPRAPDELDTNGPDGKAAHQPLEVARVKALGALLSGDPAAARQALRDTSNTTNAAVWTEPLLQAATNRRKTSEALRAITRAASDRIIDPVTEVVCGAALRQSDFVFNRMLRLHKQNESVPLRILWLPQTSFLRKHARFEEIVSAEGLVPFWQDHGLPDICNVEPALYGCKLRAAARQPGVERDSFRRVSATATAQRPGERKDLAVALLH